jgi:ABC-type transporter Mla subunit MlaD
MEAGDKIEMAARNSPFETKFIKLIQDAKSNEMRPVTDNLSRQEKIISAFSSVLENFSIELGGEMKKLRGEVKNIAEIVSSLDNGAEKIDASVSKAESDLGFFKGQIAMMEVSMSYYGTTGKSIDRCVGRIEAKVNQAEAEIYRLNLETGFLARRLENPKEPQCILLSS